MEGLTPFSQSAAQVHEVFKTYTEAGFTEDQALKLIAYVLIFGSKDN